MCVTSLIGVTSAAPGVEPGGGVDPATVELTLGPGQSAAVAKHVTTPAVAPNPDVVILGDTTGSMDPVVANVRNNIDTIMDRVRASQPTARFAITAYKEVVDGDKVFRVFTPLTDDQNAVRAGVDIMAHDVFGGGAPWTDFINAHFRIASGDAGTWRPSGSRVIMWFGDAVSHDPSLAHTLADTNAALRSIGARVIAVPVVGTSGNGLDALGQATSIVNATGGRLMANSNADQVADALLAGLENLDVTVTPHVNSCDAPLTVGFDATSRTVRSATVADFAETVRVRQDAAAGTYHCSIDFLINGVSAGLVQNTTVHVPGLSIGDVTVTEGDSGNTQAVFPVTLDRAAATPVTVHVATADGTAVQGGDYLATNVDVRFETGQLTQTVAVPIVGDGVPEQTETFTVNLSGASGSAIGDGQGVGTILDNDMAGSRLSVGDASVNEGNDGTTRAVFTVSLDQAASQDVTVRGSTADGTATVADHDYAAVNEVITIPAGQTSRQVVVPVSGDTRAEPDETFTVNLTEPVGASIVDGQGVGTIVNDDPPTTRPRVSIDDVSVAEGNAGTTPATFTIRLDKAPNQGDVRVHWATVDGTASVSDNDFVAASGDEVFTGQETSRQVTVPVNGDTRFEPDETFVVQLSGVTNADVGDGQGVGTIRNDDPEVRPELRIDDVSVAEGNSGTTAATFTISLSQAPGATPVEVDLATVDGTASVSDNDFVAAGRRETFTGDETSRQITVQVNGDTRAEPDETFVVRLSNVLNGSIVDGDGVGTIRNDDPEPSELSVGDVRLQEGNSGTTQAVFTVSLDRPSNGTVRVHAATHDGTALVSDNDYAFVERDLTFGVGATSQTFAVDIKGDNKFEPDESFTVDLSNPENASILDGQGVGVIVNDDPDVLPEVSIGDVSVLEGDSGTSQATFTVSLDRPPTRGDVSVHWTTVAGTANGDDFNAASGDLVFRDAETSKVVYIGINGDITVETDETFVVRLSAVSNARLVDDQGVGTIRNDDVPTDLQLSIGDTTVLEGNAGTASATFTITLNQAPTTGEVTVRWATQDGTATVADGDYTAVSGVAHFPVGVASQDVVVPVAGDTRIEDNESFTVVLTEPSGSARTVHSPGIGTIRNDDGVTPPPPAPRLSIGDTSVAEGNVGTTSAVFTVTLANGPTDRDVTVDYATHDGSATAPGDYTTTADRLTFHAGEASKTIQVPVVGDGVVEPDETFTVTLSGASAEIVTGTGTAVVRNDDSSTPPARPQLSIGDTRVVEGNDGVTRAVFTVNLNRAAGSTEPIGVDYTTADGTATVADHDYAARSGRLDFTGAKTSDTIIVDVFGDTRFEPDESFLVQLANASGADIASPGTGTIVNDDDPAPLPRAAIGDVRVTEGNNGRTQATFTVTLDRMPVAPASLHYATANGTAIAPSDYVAVSGDLSFSGVTSRTLTVEVVGDIVGEPDETFTVELSAPSGLTIVDGSGLGTITNDDSLRSGVFTCTATALNKVGSTANPPNQPCRDDSGSTQLVNLNLGLLSIKGTGLTATTDQTPDDLNTLPAAGDNATSHAELASVKIRVLAVTIEVGLISSTAIARCVPGSDGLTPEFTATSTVTALKINGLAVPIGSGPVHIPLLVGSLDLNLTHTTANSITQTAFMLNTILGKITIAESSAGVHASPGSPVTPNKNPCHA